MWYLHTLLPAATAVTVADAVRASAACRQATARLLGCNAPRHGLYLRTSLNELCLVDHLHQPILLTHTLPAPTARADPAVVGHDVRVRVCVVIL